MENVPSDIIIKIVQYSEDVFDVKQLLYMALISKKFFNAVKPILSRRLLIKRFAKTTLPRIIYNRALYVTPDTRVINMSELINNHIFTINEAKIVYDNHKRGKSTVLAIATIIDVIKTRESKKLWLNFFQTLGINQSEAARALAALPREPHPFSFVEL